MYQIFLALHNLVRWIVLILAIVALVRAYLGWFGNRDWTEQDRRVGVFFSSALDTQLVLGLILYIFLSPLTTQIFRNFSAAMSDPSVRFFGLEHLFYMVGAVALVHVGTVFSRRAEQPSTKHRNAAIFFSLAVLLIILAIPWSRPLIRGF